MLLRGISTNKIKCERYYLNMIQCQRCYLNLHLQKITMKRKHCICAFDMSKHNWFILTVRSCCKQLKNVITCITEIHLLSTGCFKFGHWVTACILAQSCIVYSSLFLHSHSQMPLKSLFNFAFMQWADTFIHNVFKKDILTVHDFPGIWFNFIRTEHLNCCWVIRAQNMDIVIKILF